MEIREDDRNARSMAAPAGYLNWIKDLKERIRQAQLRAGLSVNRELTLLYWEMGRDIIEKQQAQGWGAKVIDRLSMDLRDSFPGIKGFSPRNLKYMRAFAAAWPDKEFVQQVLHKLPWGHQVRILDYVKTPGERKWYALQAIEHGWSRSILVLQIESGLFERRGGGISNFSRTLPSPQSDLANEIMKDPYDFDFLCLDDQARERDLERGLLDHLKRFLLELGVGFAFVGNQFHLEVGDQDFFMDLLFYHTRLHCYVVIEIKMTEFRPEYSGKMNFYLSAVDDKLRHPDDAPSIGLILCKGKNGLVAEYALRDLNKPVGITEFRLTDALPSELESSLPSIELLEQGLNDV